MGRSELRLGGYSLLRLHLHFTGVLVELLPWCFISPEASGY